MAVLIINVLRVDGPITVGRGKRQVKNGKVYTQQFTVIDWLTKGGFICNIRVTFACWNFYCLKTISLKTIKKIPVGNCDNYTHMLQMNAP